MYRRPCALALLPILVSTLAHGFSAGSFVWAATHEEEAEKG